MNHLMRYENFNERFYILNIINVNYVIDVIVFNNHNNLLTLNSDFVA